MTRLTPYQHAIKVLEKQAKAIEGRIEQLKIQLVNTRKLIVEMKEQSQAE